MKRKRAIVVITEGASWQLLEQYRQAGQLPGFDALFSQGTAGPLRSELVPYEVPGLTSAFTGRSPADHGWLSYWVAQTEGEQPQVLRPEQLKVPHIWRRAECERLKFGIINVFGTHPAEPLNGYVITYPMAQTVRASHPPSLLHELSKSGVSYAHDVSIWYAGQPREEFLTRVLEADRQRGLAAQELWARAVDVLIVNLTAIDRVCHFYYQELEPGSPIAADKTAPFLAFATADRILQQLLQHVDDSTALLAFSEIGFGPLRAFVSVNKALERAGHLKFRDSACTQVDRAHSAAFEAAQGTHGVLINVAGRQAHGVVEAQDYKRVRAEVRACLCATHNPYTGLPLFRQVYEREELYQGAAVLHAPDLIVEPADERYQPLGDPFWATHVNRHLQSGWHRRDSYLAAVGGPFASGKASARRARPVDLTAMLYRALDLDLPKEFAGEVLC